MPDIRNDKVEPVSQAMQTALICIENKVEGRPIDTNVVMPNSLDAVAQLASAAIQIGASLVTSFDQPSSIIIDALRMNALKGGDLMIDVHLQRAARKRRCAAPQCDQWSAWAQNTCRSHDLSRVSKPKRKLASVKSDDEWFALTARVKIGLVIAGRCDACQGEAWRSLGTRQLCRSCHNVRAGRQ